MDEHACRVAGRHLGEASKADGFVRNGSVNPCCSVREARVAGGTNEGDPLRLGDSVLLRPGKTGHCVGMIHGTIMAVLCGGPKVACTLLAGLAITKVIAVLVLIFLMGSVRWHLHCILLPALVWHVGHRGSFQPTGSWPQGITTEVLRDSNEG